MAATLLLQVGVTQPGHASQCRNHQSCRQPGRALLQVRVLCNSLRMRLAVGSRRTPWRHAVPSSTHLDCACKPANKLSQLVVVLLEHTQPARQLLALSKQGLHLQANIQDIDGFGIQHGYLDQTVIQHTRHCSQFKLSQTCQHGAWLAQPQTLAAAPAGMASCPSTLVHHPQLLTLLVHSRLLARLNITYTSLHSRNTHADGRTSASRSSTRSS